MVDSLTYKLDIHMFLWWPGHQGPVVRRPVSANPGLNVLPRFLFLLFTKGFSRIIFFLLVRVSKHHIVGKKNKTQFVSQAFISEIKFRTKPGLT